MRTVLHLVTRPNDTLAAEVIALQKVTPELELRIVDLTGNEPDYAKVLEEIFRADSVEVW
jgi:hypothetical protein